MNSIKLCTKHTICEHKETECLYIFLDNTTVSTRNKHRYRTEHRPININRIQHTTNNTIFRYIHRTTKTKSTTNFQYTKTTTNRRTKKPNKYS